MGLNDWLKRGKNYRNDEDIEYYEDAHNVADGQGNYNDAAGAKYYTQPAYSSAPDFKQPQPSQGMPLPNANQFVSPRLYQNVVVYEPHTPEDVQTLIDYLKRREPAIINLDNVSDVTVAQRILDFTSGAIYALNGSVHRISNNIFLLSPEGVEITVPYEPK